MRSMFAMEVGKGLFVRPAAVLVALLLAVTNALAMNHCELGGMARPESAPKHSCCSDPSAPKKSAAPAEYAECCVPPAAPLPALAFAPAIQLHALYAAWVLEDALRPDARAIASPDVCGIDTGPSPGIPPLETDLRRATPPHAPPFAV